MELCIIMQSKLLGIKNMKASSTIFVFLLTVFSCNLVFSAVGESIFAPTVTYEFEDLNTLTPDYDTSVTQFSCWACNSTDETDDCFNLTEEYQTKDRIQLCASNQQFCKVERVWYVLGVNKSAHNFSIYRNCSAACEPYCLIMGDRTKLYSCSTCCQDALCNTGSGEESRHLSSNSFILGSQMLGIIVKYFSSSFAIR